MEPLHPTSLRGVGWETPVSTHGSRAAASDSGSAARGQRSRRRRRRTLIAPLALAVAVGALAGPAAALPAEQNLRSADATDAGLTATVRAAEPAQGPQNLRSADANDAALAASGGRPEAASGGRAEPARTAQDLRSADASAAGASVQRGAGRGADRAASSDFDWGDAAIGAGSVLALAGVSLGIVLALQARRRRHARPPASAVTTS
jgi:hypothetical protein